MNTTTARESAAQTPWVIRAYTGFALIASVISFSVFFVPPLSRLIVPYEGWSGLAIYPFTLFFLFMALRTQNRRHIYTVARLLGLGVAFGLLDMYRHSGPDGAKPDFGNPYLMYNSLRPIFTVTVPAFWLFMLISPMTKRWIKAGSAN